jgi:ribosomal protein S18 acetylase RimI-like enzyme
MAPSLRPARLSDIDRLVEVENRVFAHDRISRRSFRQLIARETADTLVAEIDGVIVGYCMVLYRKGSGVARLYSVAVDPGAAGGGIGRALLDAAERAAFEQARLLLRLEVRENNERALALYRQNGYRRIGREENYYEDGAPALRLEKLLRGDARPSAVVPYYEQTVDFSCGPCCIMMAKAFYDPAFVPGPVMEIRLWREATTVFMMSGPGGCEPFGLAVAAFEHGLSARIIVSFHGALFLQSVRSEEKRRVMELAQVDFRSRADAYGIAVDYRTFGIEDIRGALAEGNLVVVLISGFLMFGKKVPHWVLVIGDDDEHLIIHDPWVEDEHDETSADAANIPVPHDIFMRMAQFGRPGLRSAVILGKKQQP